LNDFQRLFKFTDIGANRGRVNDLLLMVNNNSHVSIITVFATCSLSLLQRIRDCVRLWTVLEIDYDGPHPITPRTILHSPFVAF